MTTSIINKLETSVNDNARVFIYDCHMFIAQATGVGGSSIFSSSHDTAHPQSNVLYPTVLENKMR